MTENWVLLAATLAWLADRLTRTATSYKTAKRRDGIKAAKEAGK